MRRSSRSFNDASVSTGNPAWRGGCGEREESKRERERERKREEARACLRRRLQVGGEREERAMGAERWVEEAENGQERVCGRIIRVETISAQNI